MNTTASNARLHKMVGCALFAAHPAVDGLVLVAGGNRRQCEAIAAACPKPCTVVQGGATRADSVHNGLAAAKGQLVAIHDAARPFASREVITQVLQAAAKTGAAAPAVPVKDTIKVVGTDGIVTATPERSTLMAVQTPQIFTAELLKQAYAQLAAHPAAVTDDASVVELMGHKVATALGRYENIKITTPEDLLFAENLLAQQEQEDGK